MSDSRSQTPTQAASPSDRERSRAVPPASRPRWSRPRLVEHGDVRELTLGTSQGLPESGAPGSLRF